MLHLYENVNRATCPSYQFKLQDTSQPICKILKLPSYKLQIFRTDRFSGVTFPIRVLHNFRKKNYVKKLYDGRQKKLRVSSATFNNQNFVVLMYKIF